MKRIPMAVAVSMLLLGSVCRSSETAADPSERVAPPGVPQGSLTPGVLRESRVFPGTTHAFQVYVPAQYAAQTPPALMVFQDGAAYAKPDGAFRVPVVFDDLIHRGVMPVTVAVFVDPGVVPPTRPGAKPKAVRSFEYDSLSDRYVRFLVEELLPSALKGLTVSADPAQRAICGMSSGGISAFTAAWERPDEFGKVMSHIGSFTNIRGGDAYSALVRKTEPKPLRVYLEDTSGDLDNLHGNWPLANQQLAAALASMGYDVRFDYADGFGHDGIHGGSLFPDALAWLWRAGKHEPVYDTARPLAGDRSLRRQLIPQEGWAVVAEGLGLADGLCTDADGNLYFSDMKAPAVHRVAAADGSRTTIAKEAATGLTFGPDGLLYACQGGQRRVISLDPRTGGVRTVAGGVDPNDLAVTSDGFLLFTETQPGQVSRINLGTGVVSVVATGLAGPNGIALTNDGGTLAVSEYRGGHVWTFRVNPAQPLTSCGLAGLDHEHLYVANGDTIY